MASTRGHLERINATFPLPRARRGTACAPAREKQELYQADSGRNTARRRRHRRDCGVPRRRKTAMSCATPNLFSAREENNKRFKAVNVFPPRFHRKAQLIPWKRLRDCQTLLFLILYTEKFPPWLSGPVCLEDLTHSAAVKVLPCRHAYHAECIDMWGEQSSKW